MAVTATFKRNHYTDDLTTGQEFGTATLSGTYVTGGFTWNVQFGGNPGTSPLSGTPLAVQFLSPLGYVYVTSFSGNTATTKIFSAANTELANGSTPEASVPFISIKRKATS